MNADFRDLIEALLEHDVRFLVVGGIALAAHGLPRATGDMDVWVRPDAANAERVYAALVAFGAPLGEQGVNADDFATPAVVTQFGVPPRRIDVLTVVAGLDFDTAWRRRRPIYRLKPTSRYGGATTCSLPSSHRVSDGIGQWWRSRSCAETGCRMPALMACLRIASASIVLPSSAA